MKKKVKDELRPEYDFTVMEEGVRGKYAERFKEWTNLVLLEDDVAAVFHNDREVNDALRTLIRIARTKAKNAA
jgi:hypothetical protein